MSLRILVFVSLILNVSLAIVLSNLRSAGVPGTRLPQADIENGMETAHEGAPVHPGETAPHLTVTPARFHWSAVESADYKQYVANLRAMECPETTLRDIIVADIDQHYASRASQLSGVAAPWHNGSRRRADERARVLANTVLLAEKRALVKELIGYEWDHQGGAAWQQDSLTALLLGFLSEDKATRLHVIASRYLQESRAVKEAAGGILIPPDREALQALYSQFRQEAAALLSVSEMDELSLRIQAGSFLASEDIHWDGVAISGHELREFVRLSTKFRDTFAEEFLGLPRPPAVELRQRRLDFEREVETLLGQRRYSDYLRAQDPAFRDLLAFASERELPRETVVAVYSTCREAEAEALQISSNPGLSRDERAQAVAALRSITSRFVAARMRTSFEEYVNGPGHWMRALLQQPHAGEGN